MESSGVLDKAITFLSLEGVLQELISLRPRVLASQSQDSVDLKKKFNSKVLEYYQYRHFLWVRSTRPAVFHELREFYGLDEEMEEGEHAKQSDAFWQEVVRHTTGDEFNLYISW